VRRAPDGDGYQMAYGHHRFVALKELKVESIDVPCRKLDDTTMAKIMARENMEEWAWSALIEQETVRSIVEGFADGRIVLPAVKNGAGQIRIAPSFLPVGKTADDETSGHQEVSYSAATLTQFLGWEESKVEAVLNALSVIEKGLITEKEFEGLTTYQAEAVARQVRRVEKDTDDTKLAQTIGKRLASGIRSATGRRPGSGGIKEGQKQEITISTARAATDRMMGEHRQAATIKTTPPINKFAEELALKLANTFPSPQMQNKIDAITQLLAVIGRNALAGLRRARCRQVAKVAAAARSFRLDAGHNEDAGRCGQVFYYRRTDIIAYT
jgi:hypothetical protein